jgi:hypothetical protein
MFTSNFPAFQDLIRAGVFLLVLVGVIGLLRFVLRLAWKLISTAVSILLVLIALYFILRLFGLA